MNPTIKLPREIAAEKMQEIIRLNEEIKRIGEARRQADEELRKVSEEWKKVDEELRRASEGWKKTDEELRKASEEKENSIKKLVVRNRQNGQGIQEIRESIQDIFSMSKEEAEDKVRRYWNM